MAFNIKQFKSAIEKNGILQPNKYDVTINFSASASSFGLTGASIATNGTSQNLSELTQDLSYRCIGVSLPGVAIRTSDNNRLGLGIAEKMPFSGAYTDVSLSFICDRNGAAYKFWYSWINYIFAANGKESNSAVTNNRMYYTTQYKDNYSSIITITIYDPTGKPSIICDLYKAFPTSLNDISLGWSDNNNVLKLTTQISFREWAIRDVSLSN